MRILAALCALLAAGCSPLALLNAAVPMAGVQRHDAIAYGDHPRQRLDVYTPEAAAWPGPRPVVVFFYGGSWQHGERADYKFVGQALASRGFVVVVPDYRVYPEVRYPAFVQDGARAFAWTVRSIGRFGGGPAHVVLMGHSAGAQIAAMLACNPRFLAAEGVARGAVRGMIGLAGPYDFEPTDPAIRAALGGEGATDRAMPARYVQGGEPPSLLIMGDRDETVGPENQARLAARLRAAGSPVEARILPGFSHASILARLAAPIRDGELLEAIAAFAAR